jgi:ATP-binding cassette subfamily B multidrug efflux pump
MNNARPPLDQQAQSAGSALLNRFLRRFWNWTQSSAQFPFEEKGILTSAFIHRFHARAIMIVLVLIATALGLSVPTCQHRFIDDLTQGTSTMAVIWLILSLLAALGQQLLTFFFRLLGNAEGLRIQQALAQAIYNKTINLSPSARGTKTVGEIVNYYAQDVPTVGTFIEEFLPAALIAILSLLAAPAVVALTLHIPMTGILTVTATSVGISIWLGRRQARFFVLNKLNAQKRLSVVNEWLQNMRSLRFLGWTERFESRILHTRQVESRDRLAMVTNGSIMNSISQVTPFLLNVAAVLALLESRKTTVTPGEVFAVLWIFGIFYMRPLRMLPFLIANWFDAKTSAQRLENFLNLEQEKDFLLKQSPSKTASPDGKSLSVDNLNLHLSGKHLLRDISLHIPAGAFVAIIGEVGSGKTLLLHSLMRIMPATFAKYTLDGTSALDLSLADTRSTFGYVSQEGFVMSASLRDNVSFSYETADQEDLSILTALEKSQFSPEKEAMPSGLHTEIGERGVNLSGGQRQRVNLARCAFFDRPILLLDDCLSAVDVNTEKRLIADLFKGLWLRKTRILVTHRASVLSEVDWIYFLENGTIVEQGTFEQLSKDSEKMKCFIAGRGTHEGKKQ